MLCVVQASLVSVRASIREPFEIVQKRTVEVQNLQAAGEILRAVVRVRELSEKLERHLAQGEVRGSGDSTVMRELAQAAMHLREIREVIGSSDLGGIDEVRRPRPCPVAPVPAAPPAADGALRVDSGGLPSRMA